MLRRPDNARRRRDKRRLGVEIVELAFALPVMTVLVFGTLEVCELMFLKQSLAVASYEAGRLAARPGTTSEAVAARFQSIASDRRVSGATITTTPNEIASAAAGETIRIDVSAPVAANSTTRFVLTHVPDVAESVVFVKE